MGLDALGVDGPLDKREIYIDVLGTIKKRIVKPTRVNVSA
jgi:hypothetical protein